MTLENLRILHKHYTDTGQTKNAEDIEKCTNWVAPVEEVEETKVKSKVK